MPWIEYDKKNNSFEWPDHYETDRIAAAVQTTSEDVDWAIGRKKELARLKDDATLDKAMRKEYGKLYRGFCHLIFYIASDPPGDCKKEMTKELAPYADRAWGEFYRR